MSIDDDYKIILDSNKFDEEYYRVNYNIDENCYLSLSSFWC